MHRISFVSPDLEWTDGMKESVYQKIVGPLERHLKTKDLELSVHFNIERKRMCARQPGYAMSLVLQTFDGRGNEVVRRHGEEFHALVNDVSSALRSRVRKKNGPRRKFFVNPFKLLPAVSRHTAPVA